jgi:hypothetical protein
MGCPIVASRLVRSRAIHGLRVTVRDGSPVETWEYGDLTSLSARRTVKTQRAHPPAVHLHLAQRQEHARFRDRRPPSTFGWPIGRAGGSRRPCQPGARSAPDRRLRPRMHPPTRNQRSPKRCRSPKRSPDRLRQRQASDEPFIRDQNPCHRLGLWAGDHHAGKSSGHHALVDTARTSIEPL